MSVLEIEDKHLPVGFPIDTLPLAEHKSVEFSINEGVSSPSLPSTDNSHLFHIERYMEGEYRKYNSNSGFVTDELRNTPQAFSHFTFERSGHRLLVVDIQGVGDLYTDPQIHTADGVGYSDGNLGPRGMALFFHSHRCNPLCEWLGLTSFDLAPSEKAAQLTQLQRQQAARVSSAAPVSYEASGAMALDPIFATRGDVVDPVFDSEDKEVADEAVFLLAKKTDHSTPLIDKSFGQYDAIDSVGSQEAHLWCGVVLEIF
ncbi:unnamed protein product [Protopolystoma xenopodis]|uniref:Alpha-type protein kinase domain-containing protein n=1 Tax=Protopolystoma xenopodis TaxID=117903 RepID=A0A448WVH3_9PLAT|nr:unnamed protein product [Protopolystoma xenopodis]